MKTTLSQNMRRFNYLIGETDAAYHAAALKLGLSDSTMQILYAIFDSDESCLLADVCRMTGLKKQTVNSAIRGLERDGIVRLEAANAKCKRVILTGLGTALAERTVARLIAAENEIFDSWSDEEIKGYLSLTERYLTALLEKTEEL